MNDITKPGHIEVLAEGSVKPEQRVGCEEDRTAVDRSETTTAGLTLESLVAEVRPILNDLCVVCHGPEIVRLIGVMESPDDLYYITISMCGEQAYQSAVGHCESIRKGLSPAYYASLDEVFALNGGRPVPDMLVERSAASFFGPAAECNKSRDEAEG